MYYLGVDLGGKLLTGYTGAAAKPGSLRRHCRHGMPPKRGKSCRYLN